MKLLTTFILPFCLAGAGSYFYGSDKYVYSDGVRYGYVTKISKKGYICKTWEGEMNLGGIKTNDGSLASNTFQFSVSDDGVAKSVEAAAASGNRVSLHYNQMLWTPPCVRDTDYVVVGVE